MTPTSITVSNLADLLGVLGALFGFHVEDSLVAITVSPEHNEIGFRLRVDLPAVSDARLCAQVVVNHLVQNDTTHVVLAVVGRNQAIVQPLLSALHAECRDHEIDVITSGWGDGERCWSFDISAHQLTEPIAYNARTSDLMLQAIIAGVRVHDSRADYANQVAPPTGRARALAEERQRNAERLIGSNLEDDEQAIGQARHLRRLGSAISGELISELCVWLTNTRARDALWLGMDRDSADVDLAFWSKVAKNVVPPHETNPIMLLSFSAWMRGDGALARIAIERALRSDPEHRASQLLARALDCGLAPELWDQIKNQGFLSPTG